MLHTLRVLAAAAAVAAVSSYTSAAEEIVVRNNHDFAYRGAVRLTSGGRDGSYAGPAGTLVVRGGVARGAVSLQARASHRFVAGRGAPVRQTLTVAASEGGLSLSAGGSPAGTLDLGLVVVPGRSASTEDVVRQFETLPLAFKARPDGTLEADARSAGYKIAVSVEPLWPALEVAATLTRQTAGADAAYVALVRRISPPELRAVRSRTNGRTVDGWSEPAWDREFWYTRWLDWCSWETAGGRFAMVNGVTAGYTIESQPGRWIAANHFYVWEKLRENDGSLYFISEIAGPNKEQEESKYIPLRAYVPPPPGQPVELRWRLALRPSDEVGQSPLWEDKELLAFAGWRSVKQSDELTEVDIGVRSVSFGTSYFPYSTFTENFDYFRTPGLDRESWWPFSPDLWARWRAFKPMMQTDLRIIKAMGLEWVRLHHLELLGQMPRAEALAFLDFFAAECRKTGLLLFVDSAGSGEWLAEIAGRYRDIVRRVELENEVLIPGIRPGDPDRWKAMYRAAKVAAPKAEVFLTGTANQSVFGALERLGVPFDRVGIHMYKHGPGWEESFSSLASAVGAHAANLRREVTLGEFNWKSLTRLAPEERAAKLREIYGAMLQPRAISDFLQFQFQETLCVNPRLSRQGIRHYETINLDRRPKPEAQEFMQLVRQYSHERSPVREIQAFCPEVTLSAGKGRAFVAVKNMTARALSLTFQAESFSGVKAALESVRTATLKPGASVTVPVSLALSGNLHGTYHAFLRVLYEGRSTLGWIVASNPGPPTFSGPVLADRVRYEGGAAVVEKIDWRGRIFVTFAPQCPVLELEMAYLVRNTLQAATGRPVYLCQVDMLPKRHSAAGLIVHVASETNSSSRAKQSDDLTLPLSGVVRYQPGTPSRLIITGRTSEDVQAAATDFVLRYWPNAKDSACRMLALEKGAALGAKAAVGEVNPP